MKGTIINVNDHHNKHSMWFMLIVPVTWPKINPLSDLISSTNILCYHLADLSGSANTQLTGFPNICSMDSWDFDVSCQTMLWCYNAQCCDVAMLNCTHFSHIVNSRVMLRFITHLSNIPRTWVNSYNATMLTDISIPFQNSSALYFYSHCNNYVVLWNTFES